MAPILQRLHLSSSKKISSLPDANDTSNEHGKRNSLASVHLSSVSPQNDIEARKKRSILSTWRRFFPWLNRNGTDDDDEAENAFDASGADNELTSNNERLDEKLNVMSLDYLIRDNCYEHWTDSFSITNTTDSEDSNEKARLVVRRGQTFRLKVAFNRPIRKDNDIINLVFSLVNADRHNYQTYVVTPVLEDHLIAGLPTDIAWNARLAQIDGSAATINVTSSAKSVVGEWSLDVDTRSRSFENSDSNGVFIKYTSKKNFFLLYNPWCKQDPVYLKDRDAIRDYVLSDTGIIYRGSHISVRPVAWVFGQFEKHVLEASMYALTHLGSLPASDAGDPIKVARHLSQVVHSSNESTGGVVQGYWPNDGARNAYRGGTNPYNFTGSTTIMQQFYKTHKPVKYGQCWVFAGVATTMCRALGIPARPVTNYRSAHDTNQSLTVDYLFDERDHQVTLPRRDSVWNFHTWTECWMTRPDLANGGVYDGWQVLDATPQEQSDGRYRMGPASVEACKRGEIARHFDTKFLYAEVNADEAEWIVHGADQPIKLLAYRTDSIGVLIVTKAVGTQYREDITGRYKYPEKTHEEREVMLKALRLAKNNFSRYIINEMFGNVKFELQLPDDVVIGESFRTILRMRNVSRRTYTIPINMAVATTTYTGTIVDTCKSLQQTVVLGPSQEEIITMTLDYDEYEPCLVDQNSFIVHALAGVNETAHEYFKKEIFRLRMPDISIQVDGPLKERKSFKCTLTLVNPLPKPLTKGVFYLEGPGLGKPIKIPVKSKIGVNEQAQVSIMLTPRTSGTKLIVAKFRSKQLNDVDGYKELRIHPLSVWSAFDRADPLLN